MHYTEYLCVPTRKAIPGKGLTATVHNWNKSFTHIEHRQHLDGAIGREEWLNNPNPDPEYLLPSQGVSVLFPTYSLPPLRSKTLFTWSGGPRSSGVGFFCFVSPRA